MKENKKEPDIRFKGFTDAWEQRKLGDVAKFRQGIQVDLEKQYTGSAIGRERFIRIVDYTQGTDDIRYIDEVENANRVDDDDVVVVRYGATAGFVGHGITGVIANNMFTINPLDFLDKKFLYTFMKQDKMYENLNSSNGSSAMPAINFGIMNNIDISYPIIQEQKEIGAYFRSLDNLITLHQRECDQLKELKKTMLKKMFPHDGCSVPEIRFSGFTDAWEQRKAVDIADYSKGNGYSKSDLKEIGTPIILYGRLYTRYQFTITEVDTFTSPKDGSVYSQGNEVIIPASGETAEDIARASAVEKSGVLLGGDLNILRPFNFINPLFLALAISNGEPQKELAKKAQGKSVVHIHNSDIQEVTVSFPTRAEQDRIVAVFRSLDNLITLHQRELEILKNLKKTCLKRMFI